MKNQNATLLTTGINDKGETLLTYIPLSIDENIVDKLLFASECDNKQAVQFILPCSAHSYWDTMWKEITDPDISVNANNEDTNEQQ